MSEVVMSEVVTLEQVKIDETKEVVEMDFVQNGKPVKIHLAAAVMLDYLSKAFA